MKKHSAIAALFGFLLLLPCTGQAAEEEAGMAPPPAQERTLGQKFMDGYHDLKNNIAGAFGGYSGDSEADRKAYMEHYQEDLSQYHDAMRKARAEYRRARLDDQKAYLEHHNALPMQENVDADSGPLH